MVTDMHGHPLSFCTPVPGTERAVQTHTSDVCACLELRRELPSTLDDPHDGLDHL